MWFLIQCTLSSVHGPWSEFIAVILIVVHWFWHIWWAFCFLFVAVCLFLSVCFYLFVSRCHYLLNTTNIQTTKPKQVNKQTTTNKQTVARTNKPTTSVDKTDPSTSQFRSKIPFEVHVRAQCWADLTLSLDTVLCTYTSFIVVMRLGRAMSMGRGHYLTINNNER